MIIKEIKVLRGPNFWSVRHHKLMQFLLDLGELEFRPTNQIPGFYDRLQTLLPSLYTHECSEGHPGGFFSRVQDGTWMGHVVEHIALELQSLAGIEVGFGRTRSTGTEGEYHVVFAYAEEAEGEYAGRAAVELAEALVRGESYDVKAAVNRIKDLWFAQKPGPSTASILSEAAKRNIPCIRLDNGSLVQLGYGAQQKRIEATLSCRTGTIASDLAGDKQRTKELLTAANIPVPRGCVISDVENLRNAIGEVGFPVVIKPLDGNHGKGATINITAWEEAHIAFERAKKISKEIVIEKFIEGNDYRILLVNYKIEAAALRTPACITGDGQHTITELVHMLNQDPRRGLSHENMLTAVTIDEITLETLSKHGYTPDSVLPKGLHCVLKPTANISTGGTATDITDDIHPSNRLLFERVAKLIGLDICGIDVMAHSLSEPLAQSGGAIIEVNAAPGLRMHLEPTSGSPRNVAAPIVDMLFNSDGRIPIIAVTGTNGKTTTTRLIAHIVQQSGVFTGYTTTDGIYLNEELIVTGDCSGPQSAQLVLREPSVEFAVLETARGGLLRSGLGFDQCDVAVITNVAEDHLGRDGIDNIEKLAKVKSIIAEVVKPSGFAVLNADDDLVYGMRERLNCNIALFSLYSDNVRIEDHCQKGGLAAVYENGYLLLRIGQQLMPIEEAQHVPITFGGKCEFNIANVLSACLAAYTSGIKLSTIRQSIRSFVPSSETTPGRINMFSFEDFTVMLDYAHNAHGLRALGKFIKTFDASTRIGVITGVGDRRDQDIMAIGEEAARVFDEIIIRHDEDLRGRTVEEVETLITKGIVRVNPDIPITYSLPECESVHYAIEHARPEALIVILTDNIKAVTDCVREHQRNRRRAWVL
ncbi:MAG TPA: cyanophycin synthetase [Flavisolibacter sp.]|nr:cyanophycin synthetase [Flavisolibacter sp.]